MKQLGNLAIVCARRSDVQLQIKDGTVTVLVGENPPKLMYLLAWDDDSAIVGIIRELNFGLYAPKR